MFITDKDFWLALDVILVTCVLTIVVGYLLAVGWHLEGVVRHRH